MSAQRPVRAGQQLCTCKENPEAHLHVDGGTIGAEALGNSMGGYQRVSVGYLPAPRYITGAVLK